MKGPKVSIILTTCKQAKFVKQAIHSCLAQTFRDFELLIAEDWIEPQLSHEINNALFDIRMRWVLTDLPKHDLPQPEINRYAHNINLAFKESKGQYITYLCDDDLYMPYRLEIMTRALDDHPEASIVYGSQLVGTEKEFRFSIEGLREAKEVLKSAYGLVDHSSVMHRRECFGEGWDEGAPMRFGDAFFWNRLQRAGYTFHPIAWITDIHRFNSESVTWQIDHPDKDLVKTASI